EAFDLVLDAGEAGEDQNRGLDLGDPQGTQNLEARHVRQVQVEHDDVVIVQFPTVDAFFGQVGRVNVEAFRFERKLDRFRSGGIVEAFGVEHEVDRWRGGPIVFNQ